MDERTCESFDKYITYPIAISIAPFFHYFGITPNMVTIFNIFFRFFILLRILQNKKDLTTLILLVISHFLDSLDGTIARMYNQKTKLGAQLDGISDGVFWVLMFMIILKSCRNNFASFFIVYTLFISVSIVFLNKPGNRKLYNLMIFNAIPIIILIYYFYMQC